MVFPSVRSDDVKMIEINNNLVNKLWKWYIAVAFQLKENPLICRSSEDISLSTVSTTIII